jgi:ribulose kinase
MQKKFLIGVDLGTSSTKAALYQVNGKILSQSTADVPLMNPTPGLVEQKNEDFLSSAAHTVRTCTSSQASNQQTSPPLPLILKWQGLDWGMRILNR